MSVSGCIFQEIFATAILLVAVNAVGNNSGSLNPAFCMGFILWGIGASMGIQTGYALNPARDLGPRVFTWLVGYKNVWYFPDGDDCFYKTELKHYWWIPIIGPIIGAFLGQLIYQIFIGSHLVVSGSDKMSFKNASFSEISPDGQGF